MMMMTWFFTCDDATCCEELSFVVDDGFTLLGTLKSDPKYIFVILVIGNFECG